jgi:hypothetical protein
MLAMSEQREPDHTEDPREQEIGEGYPETAPADANPDEDEERLPDE